MKCFNLICGFAVGVTALLVSSPSFGASVTKISTSRGLVLIDEGSGQGISYRDKICIYSDSGSKVACGLVVNAKEDSSFVVISQARVRKVRKGMRADPEGSSENYSQGQDSGDYEQQESSGSKAASGGFGSGLRGKLNYVLSVIPQTRTSGPVPYDPVAMNRPPKLPADAVGDPNWGVPTNIGLIGKMRLIGVGGEIDFGVTKSIRAAVGLRYKLGGYPNTFDGESIEMANTISELSGSSIGGYLDAYLINRPVGPVNLSAGVGVDFEMNSVTFKTGDRATTAGSTAAGTEDATASKIGTVSYEGTASGSIVSVRVPIEVSFPVMKKLSIGVKLVPMYSVLALGRSVNFTTQGTSGTMPPQGTAAGTTTGEETNAADAVKYDDYFSALGVEPAGLAFEMYPISIQYSF